LDSRQRPWTRVVRVVGHGDEVLAVLRDTPPDLVVLDIMLPGRSGLDVLRDPRTTGEARC
jgi:two-component system response regulator BaeR